MKQLFDIGDDYGLFEDLNKIFVLLAVDQAFFGDETAQHSVRTLVYIFALT